MLAIELADHRYVHHLMCYGGTFGITPAFAADYFGARHVGATFGFMMMVRAFPAGTGLRRNPRRLRLPQAAA